MLPLLFAQTPPAPSPVPAPLVAPAPPAIAPAPATAAPAPPPAVLSQPVLRPQEVRPLPGRLDPVPVFNSNSPELVQTDGVLLSTFPGEGRANPTAHLNYPLEGRFDIFLHHIGKEDIGEPDKGLFVALVAGNPGDRPLTLTRLSGQAYLTQPDAPFLPFPAITSNDAGLIYSGPGGRVTTDLVRQLPSPFPSEWVIPPRTTQVLWVWTVPLRGVRPALNGLSGLLQLRSDAPVELATLALYRPADSAGVVAANDIPKPEDWLALLQTGTLAGPRDKAPTPPDKPGGIIYGRVAGVSIGNRWQARLADPGYRTLRLPPPGQSVSWPISTLRGGRLGTGQNQTAPMRVRYPDTAYEANGNYGVEYDLELPLTNLKPWAQTVQVRFETPIKEDRLSQGGLRFLDPPGLLSQVFFRGTVRVQYTDDQGLPQTRDWHLVQRRGQQGEPLATLTLPPYGNRRVRVRLFYPADATPPQVITLTSLPKPVP